MLDIGKLDRRIVIENFTEADNAHGEPIRTWNTFATVWAQYKDRTGQEAFEGDQYHAIRTGTFVIRWRTDLTDTKYRIQFDGHTWDILSIQELGRKVGLLIRAQALTNG
jgi:SPP1 family predicted phage head-tail adaptor